ncbi:orf27 [Artaxa digramma nucleopolyhedrovirus]|uniref:Orf27 n=1 Tax=Artaxa digramma nucleopolyhedrovirus TaxID=3070910 RepID=A0AAE6R665_9ABAC|nr:orf27 [Euproctis digramma nucleopolyhedrovirus]QHB21686.1 orf27 [Artaxa digramma nucleopolyhedrovirus]
MQNSIWKTMARHENESNDYDVDLILQQMEENLESIMLVLSSSRRRLGGGVYKRKASYNKTSKKRYTKMYCNKKNQNIYNISNATRKHKFIKKFYF